MSTTIKDVAKYAGVSHSTVSRALRGSSLISPATRDRIAKIARDMGYSPSAAARSLKTNHTNALGVVIRNIDDPFFSEVLQGIEDVAHQAGYSLFISTSQSDAERERAVVQAMREHRVDGIILCSTLFSAAQSRQLLGFGVPIVAVNNQAAEAYRYSIAHDDEDGCRQVTQHLIDLGHQRIAYLGNALSGRTTLDRLNGFQQAMEAAGLPVPNECILHAPGGQPEPGRQAAEHFLRLNPRPTALVCFNDMLAIGALRGLQAAGLRTPEDCSVTGFDNIVFSAYTNPPLTTFDQPKYTLGAEAAQMLLTLLPEGGEKSAPDLQSRTLQGRLLVRQSTVRPPL